MWDPGSYSLESLWKLSDLHQPGAQLDFSCSTVTSSSVFKPRLELQCNFCVLSATKKKKIKHKV